MEASNGAGELSNISMNSTTSKPIAVGTISLKPVPVILRPGLSPRSVVLIRPAMHGLTRLNSPKTTPTSTVSGPRIVGYTSCPRKPMQSLNKLSSVPSIVKVENPSNIRIIKEENTTALVSALRNSPISMQMNNPHDSASPSTNNTATSQRLSAIDANKSSHLSAPIHREVTREMQVRVCKRRDRRFSVLRYNSYDRLDLSGGSSDTSASSRGGSDHEVFLRRENNLRQFKATHSIVDSPSRGAGSEFGQEAKEEARLRRLGVVRQSYNAEDQPWLLTIGKGTTAKRYKGVREGNVSENVRYFIFCQTKDGNFDAYPVHEWYKLNPEVNYRYLRDEEAEAEYTRRHKTLNLFNVMVKRKLTDEMGESGGTEIKDLLSKLRTGSIYNSSDTASSGNRQATLNSDSKSGAGSSTKSARSFLLTELDEWGDLVDDEDEEDEDKDVASADQQDESGEGTFKDNLDDENSNGTAQTRRKQASGGKASKSATIRKQREAAIVARKRRGTKQRRRRRRKVIATDSSDEDEDSNEEACDESDPDDHEGDEVDYITNSSSDEEKLSADERELIYQETGVDEEEGLKALLTDNGESDVVPDESVRTRINEEELESASEEETSDNQKHRLSSREHSHRRDRSGASRSSKKRRTHAKGESGSMDSSSSSSSPSSSDASSSSSDDSSDSDMAPDDPIKISRKAEKKVEMMRKISDKVSAHVASPKLPDSVLLESTSKRPSSEDLGSSPSAKRPKPEEYSVSGPTSTSVLPVSDDALTAAVRKYLMRKPITVTDLWKKIRVKKLVPKTDDAQTLLANSLRQLKPIKQIINGQHVLSLKR